MGRVLFFGMIIWSLCCPPVALHAQTEQGGSGYDPLSANEAERSLQTAFAAGAAGGADSISAASLLRQEVLLVERHQEPKAKRADIGRRQGGTPLRRSDVYIYDYTVDRLRHVVVSLESGEVEVVGEYEGVQLPLTSNEITYAYALAFSHNGVQKVLDESYRQITGRALTSAAELNVKAFVFAADAMPDRVNQYSEECGIHRCAQLQFYTQDNTILDIEPIVDLSRGLVTQDITGNTPLINSGLNSDAPDPDIGTESEDSSADSPNVDDDSGPDVEPGSGSGSEPTTEEAAPNQDADVVFLPFVARRFLGRGNLVSVKLPNELILDRLLVLWWCDYMNQTEYRDSVSGLCGQLQSGPLGEGQ